MLSCWKMEAVTPTTAPVNIKVACPVIECPQCQEAHYLSYPAFFGVSCLFFLVLVGPPKGRGF